MSYGLIYTVPFATLDNVPCMVEIEKEGYVGETIELIAGETPFTVDISDDEFLYVPTRFSTAKLQIVGSDYLRNLFSTAYQQYRVTFKKDGIITWCGFIKPELYTQDYTSETFVLEIECISAMSVLEFIDYTTEGDSKKFVSLWYILQRCISIAAGQYNSVIIPHVYASSKAAYSTGENVLEDMTLSEQDFFDEDNKPMKFKEVLEEVCKFFNWTCADWKGDLYFVDVDHIGTYHKYNVVMASKVDVQINELLVQDMGFSGANHALDILPGYNKVSVLCSNYKADKTLPKENFNAMEIMNEIAVGVTELPDGSTRRARILILLPTLYDAHRYMWAGADSEDGVLKKGWNEISEEYYRSLSANDAYRIAGCHFLKRCDIQIKDGKSTVYNYDYTDILYINSYQYTGGGYYGSTLDIAAHLTDKTKPLLVIGKQSACSLYSNGVFALKIEIGINAVITNEKVSLGNPIIYLELKVGDFYYDGNKWTMEKSYFSLEFENKDRNFEKGTRLNAPNTKTLDMPYNGAEGYLIPLPDAGLAGAPQLSVLGFYSYAKSTDHWEKDYYAACYIYDLSLTFFKKDSETYIIDDSGNEDRTYENVLNENYINELDKIEFKISSNNNDGACYSKVMLGSDYLTDNLYNIILDETIRPEEMMITRCINHYSTTRIKLTQEIKERANLSPNTRLSDTFLVSKKFINAGGSIDYKMNRFECIMIEV